jgi:hypothetical protein
MTLFVGGKINLNPAYSLLKCIKIIEKDARYTVRDIAQIVWVYHYKVYILL